MPTGFSKRMSKLGFALIVITAASVIAMVATQTSCYIQTADDKPGYQTTL